MAQHTNEKQNRDKKGRFDRKLRRAKTSNLADSDNALTPPEYATRISQPSTVPFETHNEIHRMMKHREKTEKSLAERFVAKHYPDREGNWKRNQHEMRWQSTIMFRNGERAISERLCEGQKDYLPMMEPPKRLTLEISKALSSVESENHRELLTSLKAAV